MIFPTMTHNPANLDQNAPRPECDWTISDETDRDSHRFPINRCDFVQIDSEIWKTSIRPDQIPSPGIENSSPALVAIHIDLFAQRKERELRFPQSDPFQQFQF